MFKFIIKIILSIFLLGVCYLVLTVGYVYTIFVPAPPAEPSYTFAQKEITFNPVMVLTKVNTPDKLEAKSKRYSSFEVDVFYINGDFYISSEKTDKGDYKLADFFKLLKNPQESILLIDFKSSATPAIAKQLVAQVKAGGIDIEDIIIECSAASCKNFALEGFYTAIYPCCFTETLYPSERTQVIQNIENDLYASGASAFAVNIDDYAKTRDYFPNINKVVYYTKSNLPGPRRWMMKYKVMQDPKVKMFLVDER